MNQMLRGVVTGGTARSAAISGRDIAGKTGTTSDYKDAWFVGYTGGFVTAVWVGKDDNTAMRGVTGGAAPAAIWKGFMEAALPRLNVQPIPNGPPMPEGWVAPDPIGDLMGAVADPFGDSRVIDGVDPDQGQPYVPGKPAAGTPAVRDPASRRDDPPDQRPEPEPQPEKPANPLFF
jgi:penicillin-binding protein 1A